MTDYRSSDVQKLFGVSHDTIRRWADEFQQYLSPSANPGTGKHRLFTSDDVEKMALIHEMRRTNQAADDIAAALATGQRGSIPDSVEARELDLRAGLQVQILQNELEQVQSELQASREDAQHWRDRAKTLEGQLEELRKQATDSTAANETIIALNREIGKLQAMLELLKGDDD